MPPQKLYRVEEAADLLGLKPCTIRKLIFRRAIGVVRPTPRAVRIPESELLRVQIVPSEKGTQIYERLRLEVRPRRQYTSEALNETRKEILRFLVDQPSSTLVELSEELGINDRTIYHHLRVLEAIQLIARERSRATKRGVPPFIYNISEHGRAVLQNFSA